ncbi:MAG: RNA 2',3'-cyclic phosphodiesterase [Minisyncoccota bacterium]
MKRLFLAINIPKDIKQKISKKKDLLESLIPGIRFVGEENWHLTLVFLGQQGDEALLPIIRSMKDIVSSFACPEINFTGISYGPLKGTPRMIWINGDEKTSRALSTLKVSLEDELVKNKVRFKLENREFLSHITLAKFSETLRNELPELSDEFKDLNWFFEAEGLDLVESHQSQKGSEYEILQRIEFGNN